MRDWVGKLALVLTLALSLPVLPFLNAPANANGTLLTTLSSPCTHSSRNIVRSNVTFEFGFTAGGAETISQFFLQRSNSTQAYDNALWLDIYSGSTLLGRLSSSPALTYTSGSFVFTGLAGSVSIPSAGNYRAVMGANAGAANHYFCEAQDNNTYAAPVTLTTSGSAAGWGTVEMTRYNPSNYYSTYPLIRFVGSADVQRPAVNSAAPAGGSVNVTRSPTLRLNFSEPVTSGDPSASARVRLVRTSDSAVVLSWSALTAQFGGSSVSLPIPSPLEYGTQYHFEVDDDFVYDAASNGNSAVTSSAGLTFTTMERDTTRPTIVSSSPIAGQTGVPLSNEIVLTFSENVSFGNGEIALKKISDDSVIASASSQSLVLSGATLTWTHNATLSYSTSYYITLDTGLVRDLSDDMNEILAVSDSNSLQFTTMLVPDSTPPALTLSAKVSAVTSNNAVFLVSGNEPLDCGTISTTNGTDFTFNGFSTISQIVANGNSCEISANTDVAAGSSLGISISPTTSFSISDARGNAQSTISGIAVITITIPAPAPAPAPAPEPVPASGYSGWTITAGSNNWVKPGEAFQMAISLTCNETMSLNSSPYYPSMYYMVNSSPWLNGYLSSPPALSADRKTATWTVNLTAPATPGSYEMYAYGRGTVCFGDGYNFKNSSRERLLVQEAAPTTSSTVSQSISPTASSTVSPSTSAMSPTTSAPAAAGYSAWNLSVLSNGPVNPGEQIQLVVSITCNREMKLNGAPYYPSMYYYLNSQPRINGVYGRPVLSNDGKTATWTVGAIAPNAPGKFVFQAYGRDNPFGNTCFGDNYNFTYSSGTVIEVVKSVTVTESATVSPVATISPGYSSWRLSAQGNPSLTAGGQVKLTVALTCNIAMASNKAPYFPSMYYLVNASTRINGVYGSPALSNDGKTATWTVTVPAPSAGSYTFVAYGRDNPAGGTCFGDNYNFAYSTVETLTITPAAQPTPSATPTASPTPSVTPTPTPTSTANPEPSAEQTQAATPTPSETPSAPVNIEPPVMPNALVVSGATVQIQPSFLLSAVEALAESVQVDETVIVRFRIGTGDWLEATVAELKSDDTPLDLAASDATGDLEIQVVSALTNEPLGVVSYDFEVTEQGVNLTIQSPETNTTPIFVGIGLAALVVFGFVLAFIRRRKHQDEPPLTSA